MNKNMNHYFFCFKVRLLDTARPASNVHYKPFLLYLAFLRPAIDFCTAKSIIYIKFIILLIKSIYFRDKLMIMIFNCIDWYFKRIARVSIYMKKNLNIMQSWYFFYSVAQPFSKSRKFDIQQGYAVCFSETFFKA